MRRGMNDASIAAEAARDGAVAATDAARIARDAVRHKNPTKFWRCISISLTLVAGSVSYIPTPLRTKFATAYRWETSPSLYATTSAECR